MKANKIIEMSQEKSRQKVKLAMEEIQSVMRVKGLQFPDYAKEQDYLTRFSTEMKKSKKKYIKLLIFKIKAIK